MVDRLKEIPAKILKWWNKFTAKQKTIIVAIAAVVIFTFAIIIYVLSRPQFTKLGTYTSTAESAEVVAILDGAGIKHRESSDALTIEVASEQMYQANLALGSAGLSGGMLKYSDFVNSSMSTTSSDRERQWQLYAQAQLEQTLEAQSAVKKAKVILDIPPQNGTLIAQQEETSAFVTLELTSMLSASQANGLAKCIASSLGNVSTNNITIIDTEANLLFSGGSEYSITGMANSIQELQSQAENLTNVKVKRVLLGLKQYNMIDVASNLQVDYSKYQESKKEFYANPDRTEGMLTEQDLFESSSSGSSGGVPGTSSNDGESLNTYVNPDYGSSENSQTESHTVYAPNEWQWSKETIPGVIDRDKSSMAISMITYHEYYEENVKKQGLLDGISWDEFKEAKRGDILLDVSDEVKRMAADAAGIPTDKVTIIAYESPVFYDEEGLQVNPSDIFSIVMIVFIIALLAFVVLRSMNAKQEVPEEEELSVETMLQSAPEASLEDIDVEAKSETRKLIEKFVDDNPEAAAHLLRNWLEDDWG